MFALGVVVGLLLAIFDALTIERRQKFITNIFSEKGQIIPRGEVVEMKSVLEEVMENES